MTDLTDDLPPWDDVKDACNWSGLLLGNGFSQNIWQGFGYQSLFKAAQSGDGHQLSAQDVELFNRLNTTNFELVLSALSTSKAVVSALEQDAQTIVQRESSIRNALIRAVHAAHIPWNTLPHATMESVAEELSKYTSVYCTNYDLLAYWSMMKDSKKFIDYFWHDKFDIRNTEVWGEKTKVQFIHGGLHLYRLPNGQTIKRKANEEQNLLQLFGTPFKDAVPLFISEGTAEDKLGSIYRSDYLSFVLSCFTNDNSPIVIFGSSLNETDTHIVDAIAAHKNRDVAVSITKDGNIRQKKAGLIKALPNSDIKFFDAATHPLGKPEIRALT